nr:hypothetical protein Iba_chr02aCG12710 [Ipomoea batatas]
MTTTKGSSREVSKLTKIISHVTTIASALDAPGTTRAMFAEELITGNVKVILSGGGFGESLMNATHFSFSWRRGFPGNREATCPSGPIPKSIRSNCGNPLASDVLTIFRSTKCLRQDTLFRQTEQDRGVAETEAKVNGTDGDDRRKEENPVGKVRTLEEESRRGEAAMRIVDSASFYTELWKDRGSMSVE